MTVIEKPSKQQFAIVELKWGNTSHPNPALPGVVDDTDSFVRLTDNPSDVTVDGEVYLATPEMECSLAPNTALLDEKPTGIILPESAIMSEMVSGPFAPVFVTIKTVYRESGSEEVFFDHVGKLQRSVRNYRGKDGQCLLQSVTWKSLLNASPGLLATHQCQWALFGKGCNSDVSGPTPSVTNLGALDAVVVDSINGQLITLSDVFIEATKPQYWQSGWVASRNLRLKIIEWDEIYFGVGGDETTFKLEERAPDSWIGETIRLVPGCDKFVETCRDRWDNEDNFNGSGHAILTYNQMIETGS